MREAPLAGILDVRVGSASIPTPTPKVLDKGKPEDALPGIKGRQVPLPDDLTMLPGMLNSQGTKARWGWVRSGGTLHLPALLMSHV